MPLGRMTPSSVPPGSPTCADGDRSADGRFHSQTTKVFKDLTQTDGDSKSILCRCERVLISNLLFHTIKLYAVRFSFDRTIYFHGLNKFT
jgi:hypothetical protein